MNACNKIRYVAVSGYGWSGSGAVVDLLKELEGFGDIGREFWLVKHPDGVLTLDHALTEDWSLLASDNAIRNFLWLVRKLARPFPWGLSYKRRIHRDICSLADEYVDNLTSLTFTGSTYAHHTRSRCTAMSVVGEHIKKQCGWPGVGRKMWLAQPGREAFRHATQAFMNSIFVPVAERNQLDAVILDQAIPPGAIVRAAEYFNDIKFIIVDRDPRDIYVELYNGNHLIGPALRQCADSAERYIEWHKRLRVFDDYESPSAITKNRVHYVRFEDLVHSEAATRARLFAFLGGDVKHAHARRYFDPSYSCRNIGLWKRYPDTAVMDRIHDALAQDCWQI